MAQQPMTQFWPIFITKSDGLDVVNIKNVPVRNGPSEEQLDDKANEQGQRDYYRELRKDDPKHIDWRKKLGGMLLREVGGKDHETKWQQCILWDLPENYKLYEHIKTKADGQVKTAKNHSGGGHDRQDAYLYGYPKGPKKRFRSPVEFFPHLLWLNTDENSDSNNCTCRMCSPHQPETEKPAPKMEMKQESALPMKREPSNASNQGNAVGRNPTVQISARRASAGSIAQSPRTNPATPVTTQGQTPIPAQSTPSIRPPSSIQSTILPQPTSLEHFADISYGKFLCRTGEVVWFLRPKIQAWGLGLVVRRWSAKDGAAKKSYMIQPLSHPFELPTQELVTSDDDLKPWLAWSAPACTFAYLEQNPQISYGQVDWRALNSGQFGQGVPSVDASILAAKAIDSTYTLFGQRHATDEATSEVRHFNGIYLGAEKIWRGEAVRLRIGTGSDLMVITDIVERSYGTQATQSQPNAPPPSQVFVVGDIYSYATLSAPDASNPPSLPQQNTNIPVRMNYDIAWRNRTLVPMTRSLAWWKLIAAGSKLEITDIKGRWYETSILFKQDFAKAVKNNEGGNGIWMNSRGDATGLGKTSGVHRPDRIMAFGTSVPKGTSLYDGLDPPAQPVGQQQQQPQPHEVQGVDVNVAGDSNAFSIDDFMNVDHLGEDVGVEYGENFHFQ